MPRPEAGRDSTDSCTPNPTPSRSGVGQALIHEAGHTDTSQARRAGAIASQKARDVPARIGKHRVLTRIGSGGMADVFLAVTGEADHFTKLVVLKVLREGFVEDTAHVQMFLDEARLAGRLNHPNVVQTYEAGEIDGRFLLIMEYLDGKPLSAITRQIHDVEKASNHLAVMLRIIVEALFGLHYAHELTAYDGTPLSIVHRDVSPQNIFVTYDGQVKVLDFGIAKATTSHAQTRHGEIKGKIAYMAPEQFLGDETSRATDIYAMGVVLWEVLVGQRMWKDETQVRIMHKVIAGNIPRPSSVAGIVPAPLEQVCMKALALNPQDRYATAADMRDELLLRLSELGVPVDSRAVGAFVAEMFKEERHTLAEHIDERLREDALPPAIETAPTRGRSRGVTDSEAQSNFGMGDSSSSHEIISRVSQVQTAPRRHLLGIGALAMALTLSSSALFFSIGGRRQTHTMPPASTPITSLELSPPQRSVSPSSSLSHAQFVTVMVSAKPSHARLFFDEIAVEGNPGAIRVARESAMHRVRALADGYESRETEVMTDEDRRLSISLERTSVGRARAPAWRASSALGDTKVPAALDPQSVRLAATPQPTGEPGLDRPQPPARTKRERKLDGADPWE